VQVLVKLKILKQQQQISSEISDSFCSFRILSLCLCDCAFLTDTFGNGQSTPNITHTGTSRTKCPR